MTELLVAALCVAGLWLSALTLILFVRNRPVRVKFKKIRESARIPCRANEFAAGLDFYAAEDVLVPAGGSVDIPLGIAWQPSRTDCYLQLKGRSGLAFVHQIEMSNSGVVDPDYRGEIMARLENKGDKAYLIKAGDKCCQGIVLPLPGVDASEAFDLGITRRGDKGFGSTGR